MELNKIHHVAVICSDYEQSKNFYTEVLDRQAVCVLQRPRRAADRIVRKVKKTSLLGIARLTTKLYLCIVTNR